MKSSYLSLIILFFALFSCSNDNDDVKKDPDPDPVAPQENPYRTGKDSSVAKEILWENKGTIDSYFMLGYGYDATGKIAHPAWVKNSIIDIEKFAADDRNHIHMIRSTSGSAEYSYLGTEKECLKRLASIVDLTEQEAGKYKNLFKATIGSSFSDDPSFPSLDYRYCGFSSVIGVYYVRMGVSKRYIKNFLNDAFKADIQTLPAEEVIEKYGTHLLTDILIGKRIDYVYRANTTDWDVLNSWSSYNAYFYLQIPTSGLTIYKPKMAPPEKENIYMEVFEAANNQPNAWMIDITNYTGDPIVYRGLENNSDEDLTLVNFRFNSLLPIYELLDEGELKEKLHAAYEKKLCE